MRINFDGQAITGVTTSVLTNDQNAIPTTNLVKTALDLKTNTSDFNILTGNVQTISSETQTNTSNLSTLSGQVQTISSNLNIVSGNVNTLSASVVTINSNLNILSGNVQTISGQVQTISSNLNIVSGKTDTNASNLNILSGNVNTLSSQTQTLNNNFNSHTGNTSNPHNTTASQVGTYTSVQIDTNFIHKSGDTMTGGLSGTSISATTFYGDGSHLTGIGDLDNNYLDLSGGTINGNLTVTGNTTSNTLSATSISATTFYGDGSHLTGIGDLDNNYLDLSGGTISGNLSVTGNTISNTLSATSISATTFYGDGSHLSVINSITPSSAITHNLTSGLQGGQSNQYYHLTNSEYGYVSGTGVSTIVSNVNTLSGQVQTISSNLNIISGKTDTNTLNLGSLSSQTQTLNTNFNSHTGNTNNPHQTTASQLGVYTSGQTDSNFVHKSGDTMTGPLNNPNINTTTLSAITQGTGINLNSTLFQNGNILIDSTGKDVNTNYSKISWINDFAGMSLDFDAVNYIRNSNGDSVVIGSYHPLVLTGAKGFSNFGVNGFGNPSISTCVYIPNINSGSNSILRINSDPSLTQTGNLLELQRANVNQFTVDPTGNTYIGTATIDPSAVLQVDSTTKGFLPPRMTTTQRNLISTPVDGLIIYNTTTLQHEFRKNSSWIAIDSDFLRLSGGTINGNLIVTGNTISNSLSAITVSASTIENLNYIDLISGSTIPNNVGGRVFYNYTGDSLSYYPNTNPNIEVKVGQQLYTKVFNASGVLIPKGSALKIQTSVPGQINVTLAIASGFTNNEVIGVASQDIQINGYGLALNHGILSGLTLNTFNVGDILYLSDTVAGAYTATPLNLSYTSRISKIGYVIQTGTTSGQIYIKISNEDNITSLTQLETNTLAGNVISTGVYEFTGITKVSNTTFNVAPVKGWIVNNTYGNSTRPIVNNIVYSGQTGLTTPYLNSASVTYIILTSGGTISMQTTLPTPIQRRQNILLGKVAHPDRTTILTVNNTVDYDVSPMSALRDMFTPLKLINDGITLSPNGINLNFNISAGNLWGMGINWNNNQLNPNEVMLSGATPTSFLYRTQTGGTTSAVTTITPGVYDVGGVITNISAGGDAGGNRSTNQRIYLYATGIVNVQYGQTIYSSLANAIAGQQTETFVKAPNIADSGILIGILAVRRTTTDLSNTAFAVFTPASIFGESVGGVNGISTTTLQQAYDNSVTPEIVINSTLDGLSIKNGTGNADNITHIIEGLNTSGSITSFISADGSSVFNSVSANTITGTTIYGDGSNLTNISHNNTINKQGGISNQYYHLSQNEYSGVSGTSISTIISNISTVSGTVNTLNTNFNSHTGNTSNPHNTTASQVGAYTTTQSDSNFIHKSGDTMTGGLSGTTFYGNGSGLTNVVATTRVFTVSTSAYTVNSNYDVLGIDTTTYSPTLTLPFASGGTLNFLIKDIACNSSKNNITINRSGSDTIIDIATGQTSTVLGIDGGSIRFVSNGVNQWWVL